MPVLDARGRNTQHVRETVNCKVTIRGHNLPNISSLACDEWNSLWFKLLSTIKKSNFSHIETHKSIPVVSSCHSSKNVNKLISF